LEKERKFNNLLILGSAGRVGQPLLEQALRAGYRVTALVRDASRLRIQATDKLTVIEGDAADASDLEAAFAERPDAVVSTLGTYVKSPLTPMTDITHNLLRTMDKNDVSRLVLMSSMGVGESRRWGGLTEQFVIRFILRHVLADKTLQENALIESDLDWTVLRPPRILDDETRSEYHRWQDSLDGLKPRWKISRGDAAAEMLRLLEDPGTIGRACHISY
jgi:nucleoside-diphosphate-sugar epimerase